MADDQQIFLERAAAFITLCNEQAADIPGEQVALSAIYGVTRYCAWLCSKRNADTATMAANREEAVKMFGDEFNRMFADWYDHYANGNT